MTPGYNPASVSLARRRIDAQGRAFERQYQPPSQAVIDAVQAALDSKPDAEQSRWPIPPLAAIQAIVAKQFGCTVIDLRSQRRARAVTVPRQIAYYLARRLTELSLPAIGRRFRGRDHTTVLHGIWRTEQRIAADPAFAAAVGMLEAECRDALTKRVDL